MSVCYLFGIILSPECHKKCVKCVLGPQHSSSHGLPRVTLEEALFCVKWKSDGGLDTTVKNKGTAGGEI